jgi:hypothetical protein
MSVPPATEMFQFAGFASCAYEFSTGYPPSFPGRVGCPIRTSRDHRLLASPPGFSQRAASFIASQCQGIHQMPFFILIRENRRAQGQNPIGQYPRSSAISLRRTRRPHMKTLCRTQHAQAKACVGCVRLDHITNSLFTLKSTPTPDCPGKGIPRFFSERPRPRYASVLELTFVRRDAQTAAPCGRSGSVPQPSFLTPAS